MRIDIDKETFIKDCTGMLNVNIHGYIYSRFEEERKTVVSRVGKKCAEKLAKGLWAYLEAFAAPSQEGERK